MQKFYEEKKEVEELRKNFNGKKVFTLDVGGQKFKVTQKTLCWDPESDLGKLFMDEKKVELEEDGTVFMDRNPVHFTLLLDYLRNQGEKTKLKDLDLSEFLNLELKFFKIKT